LPFKEENILESVTDDKFLHTKEFYYLLHKMMVSHEKEIVSAVEPSFTWNSLIKLSTRPRFRGKIMRIRGGLADLRKQELKGEHAKERGMNGAEYWQGVILDAEGRPYLFVVTEFPESIRGDDSVELRAAFFKVWIYENQEGQQASGPVFIGKRLSRLVIPPAEGHKHLGWLFFAILLIVVGILTIAIVIEKRAGFRRNRLKRPHPKERPVSPENIQDEPPSK
jgi:hypothetical protein